NSPRLKTWPCRCSSAAWPRMLLFNDQENPWKKSGWATGSSTSRASFPAESASAARSRARWSPSRRACWPTSRPETSTRIPRTRSSRRCCGYRSRMAPRSSSSRTIPVSPGAPLGRSTCATDGCTLPPGPDHVQPPGNDGGEITEQGEGQREGDETDGQRLAKAEHPFPERGWIPRVGREPLRQIAAVDEQAPV